MSTEIIHGDCLEVMRGMADASVDAIVTDPPFGISFSYTSGNDVASDAERYAEWLRPIVVEFRRIIRPGGFVAIWQTQLYFKHFWEWFGDGIHIYCAAKNFVQLRKRAINYGYDPVVMWYDERDVPLCPPKKQAPRNLDFYVAKTAQAFLRGPKYAHPCPRPIDQMQEVICNFTLPGGVVFDAFAGSGTTGHACVFEGRDFLGVEREAAYVEIARKRIADAQAQTTLEMGAA